MIDIYFGLAFAVSLSAGAFFAASRLGRQAPHRLCDLLGIALVLFLVVFIRDLWNSQTLVELLPYSNLIVLGNWMAPTVALLGGLAWQRVPGRIARKGLLVGTMMCVAFYSLVHPLCGETPQCENLWANDVCLQSTDASCSPASAATLLRWYNIPATEQEMAELCLTRHEGTYWQGLYRGLKLKTLNTPWDVEVFSTHDLAELKQKSAAGPVILTVGISNDSDENIVYQADWGWMPGVSHSVVLFRFMTNQMVRIGDPSVDDGQENWTQADLRHLWQGHGIRLVPRVGVRTAPAISGRHQPVPTQTASPERARVLARF